MILILFMEIVVKVSKALIRCLINIPRWEEVFSGFCHGLVDLFAAGLPPGGDACYETKSKEME